MSFLFIDLFCGIGGTRLAFESVCGRCIFSCDWNKFARQTYEANFGEIPHGDIRELGIVDKIPRHDVLVAGFPCQPFSISGVSKKNSLSRPHGFEDETQGTLFFEITKILNAKRPDAFVLENVKNLLSHDRGHTIDVIYRTLRDHLGYHVYPPMLLNAEAFVPQHRERVFIVGFKEPKPFRMPLLETIGPKPKLRDILDENPDPKYTLTARLWRYLREYAAKHKAAGNGFGYGLADLDGVTRTLSARYYKDGSEILIPQGRGKAPRRLTPRECARLMGFPETFKIPVSDTQAYKQFGNSVVVPVVAKVAEHVVEALQNNGKLSPGAIPFFRPRQLTLSSSANG